MKASELLNQMESREKALSFFLKKEYVEKLIGKQVFALKNCEVFLEYCEVNGQICDLTHKAYFVVIPDDGRNSLDILVAVSNGDTHNLYFTLNGIQAEKMLNEDEVFTSVYDYLERDEEPIRYKLTIKKAV